MLNSISKEQWLNMKGTAGIVQDELENSKLLADPDSCFCELKGVHIHHKICDVEPQEHSTLQNHSVSHQNKKLVFPMILLHGFGASVFSWKQVMKPLAEVTGSKILAFDRPAFGLTSRPNLSRHHSSGTGDTKPLNPYSTAFSVLATLCFIDLFNSDKAILVGMRILLSYAGSLVAVNTYFQAPERVAALILVAPAIFAPLTITTPSIVNHKMLSKMINYIAYAITKMMRMIIDMLYCFSRILLSAILRSPLTIMLVRMAMDKFGTAIIRGAWYDPNKVSEHILTGYRKPLKTKDWDRAPMEYTAALLLGEESKPKPSLRQRLHEITCPVLIVTGDSDRIVPLWNSERLSRVIPGASFEVIEQCGHLPHEEKAEEFISIVESFLKRLVGDSNEHYP